MKHFIRNISIAVATLVVLASTVFGAYLPAQAAEPSFNFTAPSAGTSYEWGSLVAVHWEASNVDRGYRLRLFLQTSYGPLQHIAVRVRADAGEYLWTVSPGYAGGAYRIVGRLERFSESHIVLAEDITNAFTVVAPTKGGTGTVPTEQLHPVRVVSPNGEETLRQGQTSTIVWTSGSTTGISNEETRILLSRGNGLLELVAITRNTGSYQWRVPFNQPIARDYFLTVSVAGKGSDSSDGAFSILAPLASTDVRLVRAGVDNDVRVYKIISGRRLWIPSEAAFNLQGYRWEDIEDLAGEDVAQFPLVRHVRSRKDNKVYYITNNAFIREIPSDTVFLSYGNRWEDVTDVDEVDVEMYQDNNLIKLDGNPEVYLLYREESGLLVKRWIKTPEAFHELGFEWEQVTPVNEAELNFYPVGLAIT